MTTVASQVRRMLNFISVLTVLYIPVCEALDSKRILLDEPNYLEQQVDALISKVQSLTSKVADLTNRYDMSNGGGAIYVVWGRKSCTGRNTSLVYSGLVGGGWYGNEGSAVEPVCLPHDPVFGNRTKPTYYDIMHGGEFIRDGFFGSNSANQDVPCAVCSSDGSKHALMIPGRNKCYGGWKEEYHGYLGSNYYLDKRGGRYVCVHEDPEFLDGGDSKQDGYVFHGVITSCTTSLKCPPYRDNEPVTCVVCAR